MTAEQRPSSYWPHGGIAVGVTLSIVGAVLGNSGMIAAAANILTASTFLYIQQKKNGKGGDS